MGTNRQNQEQQALLRCAQQQRIYDFWNLLGDEETMLKFNLTQQELDKIISSF